MKLALIGITEGFGLDTSHLTPDALFGTEATEDFTPLFANGTIYFNPTDSQEDIVKVVPALASDSLESYVDANRLGNFTGTIYYGFKTVSGDEYSNRILDQTIAPLQAAIDLSNNQLTVGDCFRLAKEFRTPAKFMSKEPPSPEKANVMEAAANQAIRLARLYNWKIGTQDSFKIANAISLVKNRTGAKYAHAASFAFAKQLKHPRPEDKGAVDKFLDLCVDQLAKLPKAAIAYDYVVAPKSSSGFNQALAKKIADTRGSEYLIINKRMGNEVAVDKQQINDRAKIEAQKPSRQKNGKWVYKPNAFDSEQEFIDDYTENEYAKLVKMAQQMPSTDSTGIKNQKYLDKRRYVKLFSQNGAEAAAGKSVLIIDDNIVGGATIELVHEVLATLPVPPRRIDIFVPLLINQAS